MIKGIKVLVLLSIISIVMLEKTNLRMLNEETIPTNPTTTEKVETNSLEKVKMKVISLSYEKKLLTDKLNSLNLELEEAIKEVNAVLEKNSNLTTSPNNGHRLLDYECVGDFCNLSGGMGCCPRTQCTSNVGFGICYYRS